MTTIDQAVMRFAGTMILIGLALGYGISSYWYLLDALVGLNLIQASFTGFCPLVNILKKLGFKSGVAFK
ncbi:MAG: DUF2892 domain-containing protein [Alphaproteobacteria bacterium]|nr:DUF2892 domain-containing protein [Alphaproteobacteria bacterium]